MTREELEAQLRALDSSAGTIIEIKGIAPSMGSSYESSLPRERQEGRCKLLRKSIFLRSGDGIPFDVFSLTGETFKGELLLPRDRFVAVCQFSPDPQGNVLFPEEANFVSKGRKIISIG